MRYCTLTKPQCRYLERMENGQRARAICGCIEHHRALRIKSCCMSTRSKKIPLKRLESYKGYLHTDGYDVYHSLPNVKNVGCWAHMRRKFTDVLKGLSAENQKTAHANIGLRYCNRLFALEKSYLEAELTAEERLQARLENSKPIAEEFLAWAKAIAPRTPPRSCFGQAITYALNQEEYLMNVFLDGRLELSNNIAENSIRPFAVGRKN